MSEEQVLHALNALYSSKDKSEKEKANEFLEQFQKTSDAWTITHNVLSRSNYPVEAKLFCAQTLRSKVSYDLHQVPVQNRIELKNSLIKLLSLSINESRAVATQLSVALSNLALQVLEWKNVVEEMVSIFGQSDNSLSMTCLLEFLKVLPEELSDLRGTSLTDEEFRMRTAELLEQNNKKVLQLLVTYVHTPESRSNQTLVFECVNSWLKEIDINEIVDTPLITLIFDALSNDDTFEPAVECICSIIRETRETSESLNVINAIYPKVISLRPRIASHMHDPEVFRGYTKLFSEAGESWHVLIAQEPIKFRNLVECVAECTAYDEDLDVVQYTFYFWYSLKTMLTMKRFVEARNELADIYLKLIDVIIHHLRYPDGADNDLFSGDREEEDKFRSFRHEMGDVLKDCCAVVGSGKALHSAYEKIYTCLELQASGNSSVQWQDIEAPLFSMRAMAREVELTEHEILPNIMKMLVQLPEHPKIRYAATLVLGRYTEWTAKHPEYLDFQLQYITSGFAVEDRDVMSAAAQALMHFCQDCSELLVNYVEQLYPFYEKVARELTLESLYEVTNGIAHVVASQSIQNIYVALQKFCKPIVDRLLLKAQQAGNEDLYRSIADEIELLTIFVSIVRPSHQEQKDSLAIASQNIHPTSQFVVELYPVLVGTLLHAHGKSPFVAERTSKFIKTCLQSCGIQLLPILGQVADTLVSEFERTHFGCYLWVSGALVREFGDDFDGEVPIDENTKESVWQFSYRQAVAFYRRLNGANPKDIADLIEDFFRLMNDVLMLYPFKHITSDLFQPSFEAALTALDLEQTDPLISTLHFLEDLLKYGTSSPPFSLRQNVEIPAQVKENVISLAAMQGQQLCAKLVSGLIFSFPGECLTDASQLVLILLQLVSAPEQAMTWLSSTLDLLPPGSISDDEKSKLLGRINTAINSCDYKRVRTLIKDFTALYSRRNVTPRSGHLQSIEGLSKGFSYNN